MKILGWNCHGICNAATVRALKAHLKGNSPDVVFLSETKASFSRMQFILKSIKFADMCVVEAKGIAGGICMMWRSGITIQKVEFNKNLIAVKVVDAMRSWLLVGFYGPPYPAKKQKAWENLMTLLESCNCPWACLGDFNFTLEDNEISTNGSRGAGDSKNNFLKELVFEFGAIDLGYSGNAFTWARGKWGSAAIKRRLDRTIANISWRLAFPDATVTHLGAINSYHKPILLDTNPS